MAACDRDKIKADGAYGAPDLVVEGLFPGTAKRDRGYKKGHLCQMRCPGILVQRALRRNGRKECKGIQEYTKNQLKEDEMGERLTVQPNGPFMGGK